MLIQPSWPLTGTFVSTFYCCMSRCFAVVYLLAGDRISYYRDSTFLMLHVLPFPFSLLPKYPSTRPLPMVPKVEHFQRTLPNTGLESASFLVLWSRNSINRYHVEYTSISSNHFPPLSAWSFTVTWCFDIVVLFIVSPFFRCLFPPSS